ncbi:hypothetical protein ACIBI3_31875 [Actinomadura luteofluorescens]|uniref:hypothetical protein n=1 Tax=Actinomadura luteofluorescens TaxID=46163 RepID=UPI0034846284
MSDPVTALAMTGATTLVAAMATSAWQSARARTAALFHRRGDSPRDVEAQLDRSAARVTDAGGDDGTRDGQITRWRDDLEDLLRAHPDTEGGLRVLINEIHQQLPQEQQQWVQHIIARDGGSAFGALGPGSSINVHYHTGSGHQSYTPPPEQGAEGPR